MSAEVIHAPHLNMLFYRVLHPHADLEIPGNWETVNEFAEWWMEAGMPIVFPTNPEVFLSDDATAVSIFLAASFSPKCSSIIDTLMIAAVGSAIPLPAISGAEP